MALRGQLVIAGGAARFMLAPVGARLPPGVHAMVVTVPSKVGSASRAMGLVARASARADAGALHHLVSLPTDDTDNLQASLSTNDAGARDYVASLSFNDLASLSNDDAHAGVLSLGLCLPVDDADSDSTRAALSLGLCLPVDDADSDSTRAALSFSDSTRAAAGGQAPGSADRGARLLFLGVDASSTGFGISSAALASGRASHGGKGRLVVGATAGSDEGIDNASADSTKMDLFLKKKSAVLLAWECADVDLNYTPPQMFFGDHQTLEESANKGLLLLRVLLDAGVEYSNADLWVLSHAGQSLGRLAMQAQRGRVYEGAVLEATKGLAMVCIRLLPQVAIGSTITDPFQAFVNLVRDVKAAISPV